LKRSAAVRLGGCGGPTTLDTEGPTPARASRLLTDAGAAETNITTVVEPGGPNPSPPGSVPQTEPVGPEVTMARRADAENSRKGEKMPTPSGPDDGGARKGSREHWERRVCGRHVRPPRYARTMIFRLLRVVAAVLLPLALAADCAGEPPLTYVSLGDSLAVGVGASDPQEHGYAPLYREFLERETGREVRLVQLGLSGETSERFVKGPGSQLARAEAALRKSPGATVTLSIGGNDLLRTKDGAAAEREAALVRYAENLDLILKTLREASEPPPSITVLALYNPAPGSFTYEWATRMNATIRDVAARNGVRVAAADRAFQGHEAEYAHHARYPWDIHPTDRGHEALARALAEATSRA